MSSDRTPLDVLDDVIDQEVEAAIAAITELLAATNELRQRQCDFFASRRSIEIAAERVDAALQAFAPQRAEQEG